MIDKIRGIKKDFAIGLAWNYISMVFMAVGGLCFSLLIGIFYDAEALGFFNTFYAVYMILAQVVSFGCQNAVTKFISEKPNELMRAKSYLIMSLIIVLSVSAVLNFFCRIISLVVEDNLGISSIEENAMLFGITVFAVNKIVLGYFNGLSRMAEYGIFQSFRYFFIAAFIILISILDLDREYLVLCFLCAEVLLFIIEMPSLLKNGFSSIKITKEELKKIVVFGYSILPANLILSINSKADVLCLSFITGDERMVGIYSFASLFAEGFNELFVVLRRSINPKITYNYVNNKFMDFYDEANNNIRRYGYVIGSIGAISLVVVHRFACFFMKDISYVEGSLPLVIIAAAIVINMRGVIWANLLSQVGVPNYETRVNILTIVTHLLMNMVLIYCVGMIGAAIGTAISYFVMTIIQKLYINKEVRT